MSLTVWATCIASYCDGFDKFWGRGPFSCGSSRHLRNDIRVTSLETQFP